VHLRFLIAIVRAIKGRNGIKRLRHHKNRSTKNMRITLRKLIQKE